MLIRKKRVLSIISILTISSLLLACGEKSAADTSDTSELSESKTESPEYAAAYLGKVDEYIANGTADSFALIDVNKDDTPELVAVDSAGPQDEAGNAHLFTYFDGKVCELLSVSEGYDGAHIYYSETGDSIIKTGGMSGSEGFTFYSMSKGELTQTGELFAFYNSEDDSYTYNDGEEEISKEQYSKAVTERVSDFNPYYGLDHDGINETSITVKDGYTNYEVVSTKPYSNAEEIKSQLEAR